MPTSVTLVAITPMPVPLQCRHLIQPNLAWLLTHLLYNLTLLLPTTHPMKGKTKGVGSCLPFRPQTWWPSVSGVGLLGITQPCAKPLSLATRNCQMARRPTHHQGCQADLLVFQCLWQLQRSHHCLSWQTSLLLVWRCSPWCVLLHTQLNFAESVYKCDPLHPRSLETSPG